MHFLARIAFVPFFAVLTFVLATSATAGGLQFEELKLKNDWKTYFAGRPPAVAIDADKVVHLRGGVYGGFNNLLFRLPKKYRPKGSEIYVVTNLVNSAPGRLVIFKNGYVEVQTYGPFDDGHNFTSLEVSFSRR